MKDRLAGAPGQYKATVTAEELLKMQNGEQFTITMTRDDQPIEEGTPYSKAAVLPDELAHLLCPEIEDPSPADAFAALLPLSGGTMTGSLDMGGKSIAGCLDFRSTFINAARIRCHNAGKNCTPMVLERGGHTAYLIVAYTHSGVCAYAFSASQNSTSVDTIKICGGQYANVGISANDTKSITLNFGEYSVCFVISIDNWNV